MSLFLGVAVIFSAPLAYADKGDRGWKKQDRHFTKQHNKRHSSKLHNKRHAKKLKNQHKRNRWVKSNNNTRNHNTRHNNTKHHNTRHNNTRHNNTRHNNTKHHNTRHNNTRHNNTRHNNTRHHNTRHNNHIRHNTRHNNTRFNDVFNSLVIDYVSPSHDYQTNNHYVTQNKRNVWDRQKNQKRRIRNGVKSGELTHHEAKYLRQELRRIRDKIAYYKSDGRFARHERRNIHHRLDDSSNKIYRKKHNRVTRSNQHRDHRTANHKNNRSYNYYH